MSDIAKELRSIAQWIRTPGNIDRNDAIDSCARVLENRARDLGRTPPAVGEATPTQDALGLSIDMLDADRMRAWADNFEAHGYDIGQWASVSFLVSWLRTFADRLEQTVRDVGALRRVQEGRP